MLKYDLNLKSPVLNAAGSLGFSPPRRGPVDTAEMGAFITNPVSLSRRLPAPGPRFLTFPGGFLLHTGHPNPGFPAVLRRYRLHWGRASPPVLVHLLAQRPEELAAMVRRLEKVEEVMGIEVGIPPEADEMSASALVEAAIGEFPVIVRLPLNRSAELAQALANHAITALSLGPPRGMLPGPDGSLVHGRLYGPAVLPMALAALKDIIPVGIPVMAAGGIYTRADIQAMLQAGAMAVQLDGVLWRGGVQ
jgi:dihydroorotate dehydrogenase (NAD+) catalytic subunit